MKRIAFIFPGQGAQYIGMGKDFYAAYPAAKQVFEQADDILHMKLSQSIFSGSESELTQTKNSQPAIFVTSLALLEVLKSLYGPIVPHATAGLSLGEYSALCASGHMQFADGLTLVQKRGEFMHEACEQIHGTMAVVLGLDDDAIVSAVDALNMPQEIWTANFNCPGQVVISGTKRGIEAATDALSKKGAKRILPLQVHGAFHSGLMQQAQEKLTDFINQTTFSESNVLIGMNATGNFASSLDEIRKNLISQVVSPVRWHASVSKIAPKVDLFIEVGPGKTLAGMNKRIGVTTPTVSLEKLEDLPSIERMLVNE
jgi:[acyl-carrier-protein] S-malonyltransferase